MAFMSDYAIQPDKIAPVLYQMNHAFDRHYTVALEQQELLKNNLAAIGKKIDELEEDYYIEKKIPADTYDRRRNKLAKEKKEVLDALADTGINSSNLKTTMNLLSHFPPNSLQCVLPAR